MSELDANIIVDGQKAIATVAQSGTVIKDGGVIDATAIIQTDNGPQKVVKTYDLNGGGGGGDGAIKDYEAPSYTINTTLFSSPVPIPNLDALTEAGTYRVHFDMDMEAETTVTATYIADVAAVKVSGMAIGYMQNLYVGPGAGDSVSIVRMGMVGEGGAITWADWSGNSLAEKQNKTLSSAITVGGASQTTVEGALGAINTAKLENSATGTNSLNILGSMYTNSNYSVAVKGKAYGSYSVTVGASSQSFGNSATIIGMGAQTYYCEGAIAIGSGSSVENNCEQGIAIGRSARVNAKNAIQIGNTGAAAIFNNNAKTLQIWEYQLLDGNTGKIPMARLPIVQLTQADYDALVAGGTVDANTIYCIIPA